MRIPTETEYFFCQKYEVGDKFFTSDLKKFYKCNGYSVGVKITILVRNSLIKPLYCKGSHKIRDVYWERIK